MEGIPEDSWSPFKHLYNVIKRSIATGESLTELEICLKKHKQNFAAILRNPPRNERHRNQLYSGITEGIPISGQNRTIVLSKDLVDETVIISDMFDLDEFIALELLCTAQRQMSQHPGLPRGLVAVLLYYDGRKAIACALRDLFQVTTGASWVTDVPKEISSLISSYTHCLVNNSNIISRMIDLLSDLDISKESVLLTKNRAFGHKKHQNQVLELFEDIRLALATALFNWSAQRGLQKDHVLKLLQCLSKYKPTEASGGIDDVALTLLMAVLYSYDVSVLQRQSEEMICYQNLPIINDPDFAQQIFDAITAENLRKTSNPLVSIVKFGLGLSLANMRHTSQSFQNSLTKLIDMDEQIVDEAISEKVFDFIFYFLLEKDILYKTEFFYRRIHALFTDFIELMHSKVTELRGRADETAKTVMSFSKEGLEPPANLDHSFETLMLCIGKFYEDNRAGLALCVEYWGPTDITSNFSKASSRSVSLFKFIRLAGELLPTTIFVPYLKMIAGLISCERSARSAFNLLKQGSGLSSSVTLSWDHFFASLAQYFSSLRQEHYPGSDTIYRSRTLNRGINPLEIEGLHSVLGVVRAVAKYDEIARIAICEHPNWSPIHVLLGLLTCSVPLPLKADILRTLSELARSKETAMQIWSNLELSQIIVTMPTSTSFVPCNLEFEIDQNECRLESYKLSQGILDLLYSLVTTVLPKNLGGGPRKPGFDPYLSFIINVIFLKFYNRSYKDLSEKWKIGKKCLELLCYLLKTYEVSPLDFNENRDECPHPGYHIMLQLQTKSDMLRLILTMIDDIKSKLDEYSKFHGKEHLEECGFFCLSILEEGLEKQDIFFDAHSISNTSVLLSGLNKILLDVNPRSKQPDHVFNTTRFVVYNSWLPRHALKAVNILNMVTKQPAASFQIVDIFAQNDLSRAEIRQGFVECLEQEYSYMNILSGVDDDNLVDSNGKIGLQIQEAIVKLLQDCLAQATPSIAHFLLGFDVAKDVHLNRRQYISVIETTSNCTKSLLQNLDNHLELLKSNVYDPHVERVAERSYCLLASLCANTRTSDAILRYLRCCNDFLSRHLVKLRSKHSGRSYILSQISHLLKCLAIELKITASNCQISRFQHLCELLVGVSTNNCIDGHTAATELRSYYAHTPDVLNALPTRDKSSNLLLCYLLDSIDFEFKAQTTPKWDFFDNALTVQILNECEMKTPEGQKLINVKKLHEILHEELNTVQNTIASGQRKLILQEIQTFLRYALQINEERNISFATIKLVESWSQVTEALFTCAPEAALAASNKQELILEVLQTILKKVVPNQPILDLSVLLSGTALLLLANFRYHISGAKDTSAGNSATGNGLMSSALEKENGNSFNNLSVQSSGLSLKLILKNILEWIIVSEVSSQKLRINLYTSFLNCLFILRANTTEEQAIVSNDFYVSRLDKSVRDDHIATNSAAHINTITEIFLSFGEKLIDIMCHDCIAGHDISKMLAFACIDALLELDAMSGLVNFIANRGYLSHIINSLLKSDENLCQVLYEKPENMKCLYVYECKMAMLLRLSTSHIGAELLMAHKLLDVLSNMKVYDIHPEIQRNDPYVKNQNGGFVTSVDARFRQILFPALSLCNGIISTLGTENYSAIPQIIHFIISHCELFETILRTGTTNMNLGLLQEFATVTSLIARTTNQELFLLGERHPEPNIGVTLYRIHRLMLSAYSRFMVKESTFLDFSKSENNFTEPTPVNTALHVKYFLEIASSISLYCRNTIANHSADHKANGVIFTPKIADTLERSVIENYTIKNTQSLGVVVSQLKGSVEYFISQKQVIDTLLRQRSSLPNIDFESSAKSKYSHLTEQFQEKQNQLSLCAFIIEHCMYLLWSHLDFYVRRSSRHSSTDLFPIQGAESLISLEDLRALKKNLISIFNETFCKQLLSTSEWQQNANKGFNEALLRRIKSLIQFVSNN